MLESLVLLNPPAGSRPQHLGRIVHELGFEDFEMGGSSSAPLLKGQARNLECETKAEENMGKFLLSRASRSCLWVAGVGLKRRRTVMI